MGNTNENRRQIISNIIKEKKQIDVTLLSDFLGVTKETIRQDLDYLEHKGILYRVHGGAVFREDNNDIPFDIRVKEANNLKKEIALKTIEYINDDTVIYLSASSTTLHLVPLLKLRKNLTIFTNSLSVINALKGSKHKVIVIGGEYNSKSDCMSGQYPFEMIKDIFFDICICGMDGCKDLDGPAILTNSEQLFTKMIIANSKKKFLITDHRKFHQVANYKYAKFSDFDYIICDDFIGDNKNYNIIRTK